MITMITIITMITMITMIKNYKNYSSVINKSKYLIYNLKYINEKPTIYKICR
jgi:hypothetical protein